MSTFTLKQNVDVLSHVTGANLEVFCLVQRVGGDMSEWLNSGRTDDGTTLTHGSVKRVP
jgi:hypothetical protein